MKEKKDPTILNAFFSLSLVLLFSSIVTHAFPWPIKGKAGHPIKGIAKHRNTLYQFELEPIEPRTDQNTQAHGREATELSAPIRSSHQRLGTCPSLDHL